MTALTIVFIWWTLSSILVGLMIRMPYDVFLEHKLFSTLFGIVLGPVIWCLIITHWTFYIKDVITHSLTRQ